MGEKQKVLVTGADGFIAAARAKNTDGFLNSKDKDGFEKGLEKTINWFLNKDNLAMYKSDHYNI
ncbi:MAG: hypothetical protein ABIJ59_17380 [Pseudomonadota bacterium]